MIKAKIIADSIHPQKTTRLTTFEVSFPRWILSEFNTHRQLSRNSASSRAIPIQSNIDNILFDTAIPVSWGKNQSGMVADTEVDNEVAELAEKIWLEARDNAINSAKKLSDLGIHKQIANRLIENFTYQKVIVTATEWANFFWLRNHKDAQPEIKVLAEKMFEIYKASDPYELNIGDWHTPYFEHGYWNPDSIIGLDDALKISASCCGQVSYRKNDDSLDKAHKVFDMLNLNNDSDDVRKHASPVEHQGTPIDYTWFMSSVMSDNDSVTHRTRNALWSGNLKDFIQYRHKFANESQNKF